jgi:hypothetical protein
MITVMNVIDTGGPGGAETVFLHTATRLDPARFRSVAVVSREGWLSQRVRAKGVEPLIIPASGSFHLGYLRSLLRIARRRNVDVIAAQPYTRAWPESSPEFPWYRFCTAKAMFHRRRDSRP